MAIEYSENKREETENRNAISFAFTMQTKRKSRIIVSFVLSVGIHSTGSPLLRKNKNNLAQPLKREGIHTI